MTETPEPDDVPTPLVEEGELPTDPLLAGQMLLAKGLALADDEPRTANVLILASLATSNLGVLAEMRGVAVGPPPEVTPEPTPESPLARLSLPSRMGLDMPPQEILAAMLGARSAASLDGAAVELDPRMVVIYANATMLALRAWLTEVIGVRSIALTDRQAHPGLAELLETP